MTALHWLRVDGVTSRNDGHVTGLVGRPTSLDDQSLLKLANTKQDFSPALPLGIPNLASMCWGEDGADKRAQRPAMSPWTHVHPAPTDLRSVTVVMTARGVGSLRLDRAG